MGGQVRAEVLRVSAGPWLPRRDPGDPPSGQGQEPETAVGSGRRPGIGIRPHRARPHPGHARLVPRPGDGRAVVEGGRGRAGPLAPHRGGNSARRCSQPGAVERRPARDGTGRRGPLLHDRHQRREGGDGLPGSYQVRRRFRRPLPLPAGGARGQGQARRRGWRPGACPSTRTRRASSPSTRASTSWDSTSAATATSR